jgi:lipopolysaccharide/colanic/teichoic acid biosynthesis glycosyltransferase
MSLVGPRPLLMEYLPLYNSYQRRRHAVRPGITGWAQVNGRNLVAWEDRFQMDIWYVENQNLWLDLKILYMTLARVINRDGISAEGEATMKVFKGTPE